MTATATANRERQLEFVSVLQDEGRLDRVREFVAADFADHCAPPGLPQGPDGVEAVLGMIRTAFPDHDAQVVHMVAEDDLVATYKTFTGAHTGDFFGIPPTGRRATMRVMDVVRYRDGMVSEHWNIVDLAGLQAQLAGDAAS